MVTVEEGLVFGTAGAGGRRLLCDVYRPSHRSSERRTGVLVLYGGGWVGGGIKAAAVTETGEALASVGYVAVVSEYRLAGPNGEARWPAHIHDVKAAARWMRANASTLGIDAAEIGCVGFSAGAHLALILAGTAAPSYPELEGDGGNPETSSAVQACVAVYPPTMISRGHAGSDKVARGLSKHFVETVMEPDATDRDISTASPLTHASASFPPTCLIHGNADQVVPPAESFKMYEELHSRGAHAELHMLSQAPHGGFMQDELLAPITIQAMVTFFDRCFRAPAGSLDIDPAARVGVRSRPKL